MFGLQNYKAWLREELLRLETCDVSHEKASTLQARLLTHHSEWLVFLDDPRVPPTNNLAERRARTHGVGRRPLVVLRKITFGSRSDAGATRMAKIMTVGETARRHGHRASDIYFELYTRPPTRVLQRLYAGENNPHLTALNEHDPEVLSLDMHYPLVHESNQRPYHFLHGYTQYLEQQLDLRIPVTRFQGDIHLSREEKETPPLAGEWPERFWIIVAGGKYDFTAKWWNPESYQRVVDHFQDRIQFIQCGEAGHWHPRLKNVVDCVGTTTLREFIRLVYHADGVLCPVTLAMHLAAAVETKTGRPRIRPCVVVAGGREPAHWEAYPNHQYISTNGMLACCAQGGCWKSRCQLVGDGDAKDRQNVCDNPVQVSDELRIPMCMDMIAPEEVIRRIELYHQGGLHHYLAEGGERRDKSRTIPDHHAELQHHTTDAKQRKDTTMAPTIETARLKAVPADTQRNKSIEKTTNVLIQFRHGLGDAVQLTTVLKHLRHYHPDWNIEVAALPGKQTAYVGLCDRLFSLNGQPLATESYDQIFDLDWQECGTCFADWPSTKAERCLTQIFDLTPIPELCRYVMHPRDEAFQKAKRYLEQVCKVHAGADSRYPVVLIHYEGNTSAELKNLSHDTARHVCDRLMEAGSVPVILDWDNRSPLPDGKRIHNPHADLDIWGGLGTGDAASAFWPAARTTAFSFAWTNGRHIASDRWNYCRIWTWSQRRKCTTTSPAGHRPTRRKHMST